MHCEGVSLVEFSCKARLEHDSVLALASALTQLLGAPGPAWPPEAAASVTAVRDHLLRALRVRPFRLRKGVSTRHPSFGRNALVDLAKNDVLDAAADLLDVAGALHRRGLHCEAFALEGIEGRLIEALLGAGPVEPDRSARLGP